jgi:histidinol dehydrogenase
MGKWIFFLKPCKSSWEKNGEPRERKHGIMKVINAGEFDSYWKSLREKTGGGEIYAAVENIIQAVEREGDAGVRRFASCFDKSSPQDLELSPEIPKAAWEELQKGDPPLAAALELAADHIRDFSLRQKAQFSGFEYEMSPGLFTGQRVIPVERAGVYAPGGRFPLVSSVLMGLIPAFAAGVEEVILASPPLENGFPDRRVMAAACLAGASGNWKPPRIFAMGGAQAIAALALGTETVPRADVIAGPGNKYVAAAKSLLFGRTGIDFVAGPTDVLIIAGASAEADLIAADMLAQAEHDPDARARLLVPSRDLADRVLEALETRLPSLATAAGAKLSLDAGGLVIVYKRPEEALRIANAIAPEHLELHVTDAGVWIPGLKNYGSLFIGAAAGEVLGDYSAGINHTLPTSGSARFTGGLSVRHFLKTVTSLRCTPGPGYAAALKAAELIAQAEGLAAHAESARSRRK